MSFFENDQFEEDIRRNIAFQTLVAHRDLLQLATKRQQPPTYENALGLLHELAPEIYGQIISLITHKNESEIIKYCQELAEIKSQEKKRTVTAIEIVEQQIATYQKLVDQDPTKKLIKRKLLEFIVAREKLNPTHLTENKVLNRDFNKIDREDYAKKRFENDNYVDYVVGSDNILRIRFLHPDKAEHITGADLIYERFDIPNNQVRFVWLQYKMWEKGVLYMSQAKNLEDQMQKMQDSLCKKGYCLGKDGHNHVVENYRLPYCAGFIRPTDRIQQSDSKLISSGLHVPICRALALSGEYQKIEREQIKSNSFHSRIFEELFTDNMIGSRWIPIDELDKFYTENNIFKQDNRILLYAQEHLTGNSSTKKNYDFED